MIYSIKRRERKMRWIPLKRRSEFHGCWIDFCPFLTVKAEYDSLITSLFWTNSYGFTIAIKYSKIWSLRRTKRVKRKKDEFDENIPKSSHLWNSPKPLNKIFKDLIFKENETSKKKKRWIWRKYSEVVTFVKLAQTFKCRAFDEYDDLGLAFLFINVAFVNIVDLL